MGSANKKVRSKKEKLTNEEWISKRASSFRASSLARAKRLGIDTSTVPTISEIKEYLKSSFPLKCYITDTEISTLVAELDHKIPISRHGSFDISNVAITSKWYNMAKGDMTDVEFVELLSAISSWEDKGKSVISRLVRSNKIYNRIKK